MDISGRAGVDRRVKISNTHLANRNEERTLRVPREIVPDFQLRIFAFLVAKIKLLVAFQAPPKGKDVPGTPFERKVKVALMFCSSAMSVSCLSTRA